jgi:hypothetical protein
VRLLSEYVEGFLADGDSDQQKLGRTLRTSQRKWDAIRGKDPLTAFSEVVTRYNWLGQPKTKLKYKVSQNLARNLPGALLQDYLIHVCISRLEAYPELEVFTEVRVPFGAYPVWEAGEVLRKSPSQVVDVVVGYRFVDGHRVAPVGPWPRPAISKLEKGEVVCPLIAINSKIRVSQSEFFDWVGREELLTKGNPSCLSLQVALRSEMDLSIPELAQLSEQFILLGKGGERAVVGDEHEVVELIEVIDRHLEERMVAP